MAAAAPRAIPLRHVFKRWLDDGRAQGWSGKTIRDRQTALERFCWWLEHEEEAPLDLEALTPDRIRAFLTYAREEHPTGRFGCDRSSSRRRARPATANAYFRILRALSNFALAEGLLKETPLRNVKAPKIPRDRIKPFSAEEVQLLIDGARRSRVPERDAAIIMLLVDTGMRVSEFCGLTVGDADRGTGELTVLGKGDKTRQVFMGVTARRALWRYLEALRREAAADEPLFTSSGGRIAGAGLTPSGVYQMIRGTGERARVTGVRCSPHTCRHTFAINFLRGGGNLMELQELLGHEDMTVLQRYVEIAKVDLERAHRGASPADRMKLK